MKYNEISTRKFKVIIEVKNKDSEKAKKDLIFALKSLDIKVLDILNVKESKTEKQFKALHLWFKLLADELNEKGFDQKKIIQVDIPWNEYSVKERLWRPTQIIMTGKKSTTRLDRNEIDPIYDVINRAIIERTKGKVTVPMFPEKHQMEQEAINYLKLKNLIN